MAVMKVLTVNLSVDHVRRIDELVRLGLFGSRGDFIREALRRFLQNPRPLYVVLRGYVTTSVKLPEGLIREMDALIKRGLYRAYGEIVRDAVEAALRENPLAVREDGVELLRGRW